MTGNIDGVRAKVQGYLVDEFNGVTLGKDGVLSVRNGSSRAFVRVWSPENSDVTFVNLTIPLLMELPETPELFEHIAMHADDYIFGHLSLERWDQGLAVMFSHSLLGDYLDQEELNHALYGMLGSADDLDDELKGRFGGSRFHED